jgi:hypothetical protein
MLKYAFRNPDTMRTESIYIDPDKKIDVAFFDDMPECHCARYARLAADYVFGLNYPVASAWKMREQTPHQKTNNGEFMMLSTIEAVKPGVLVGIYFPGSKFNADGRPYTHMSLFVGLQNGKPIFLEQMVDEIRRISIEDYALEGMQIREIIYPITVPLKSFP